ncbi:MAG: class I SAM-dependent RNA methyltransferase [Rhodospirillales bacterium]|nr:class I SAM-dependent RNA methyltransferase [Rhodospirillales bacterium]
MASGGDGVVRGATGPVFVPFVLPGERVRLGTVARRGQALTASAELVAASDERIDPACQHFSQCGGCRLQHWADAPYRAWKRGRVVAALARAGFAGVPVAEMVAASTGTRRRLDLAARREGGRVVLGLHAAREERVVDLLACPITAPPLVALLAPLRALLAQLGGWRQRAEVHLNLLDTGPDLLIRGEAELTAADRTRLAAFAQAAGVTRIAWQVGREAPEIAVQMSRPSIGFGGVGVTPPPGAFLQASAEAEAVIVAAVLAALPTKGAVLDLFAGVGTISLPIAHQHAVLAVEGDAAACAALDAAARSAGGRVRVLRRDLARRPMMAGELRGFAAVVLDPPYGGAREQVAALAEAAVGRVVMVSCNPEALARDAATLRAAGYACESAVPIDAFLWSAEVETVAAFRRTAR